MRRLAVLVVAGAMLVSLMGVAQATGKTYIRDCVSVKYRPRAIYFACDGAYYVKKLHWRFWRLRKAVGHGVYHINDCKPDCARGTFHTRRGKLILRYRLWCKSVGKYLFKRATAIYNRPYQGKTTERFRASFCPPG